MPDLDANQMLLDIEAIKQLKARYFWAMFDYVDIPGRPSRQGYGHYHETYRKESDGWRIVEGRCAIRAPTQWTTSGVCSPPAPTGTSGPRHR